MIFFFKQKTAYEMRISDWSSDVCSSDLGVDVFALNFRYRIDGDRAPWRPARAFDDGRQVFIEFPAGISQGEMPPLFVTGAAGDAELVNYRVQRAAARRVGTACVRQCISRGSRFT